MERIGWSGANGLIISASAKTLNQARHLSNDLMKALFLQGLPSNKVLFHGGMRPYTRTVISVAQREAVTRVSNSGVDVPKMPQSLRESPP